MAEEGQNGDVSSPTTPKPRTDLHRCERGPKGSATSSTTLSWLRLSERVSFVDEFGCHPGSSEPLNIGEFRVLAQILGSRHRALPRCSIARRRVRVRPRTPCRPAMGMDAPSGFCR